jgi:hypothetical protein
LNRWAECIVAHQTIHHSQEYPSRITLPITEVDPLWNIVDLVGDEYDGPTDVSTNKYSYIAEHSEIKLD